MPFPSPTDQPARPEAPRRRRARAQGPKAEALPAANGHSVSYIDGYRPGRDQIEITIHSPPPNVAVDVDLQPCLDGRGTEIHVTGRVRAVLMGVDPDQVEANDLFIEFIG